MNARHAALIVALLATTGAAQAADPVYLTLDHSTDSLLDKAGADAIWAESLSGKTAKLNKLYPVKKWGFVSQVEGGFTASKTCVVTARAMMMPVTMTKSLLFKPSKTATAFEALPGATREQCQDAAKAKLKEAIAGVLSSLSN
ncbi:MAG: hypothetical protein U1F53_06340 [Burkholderiaceae bacterium]